MNSGKGLSVEILGRITLLQSIVTLLPDPGSILKFICHGLKDISGVRNLTYRIFDSNTSLLDAESRENMHIFPIRHNAVTYAELNFDIIENEAFEPYIPFIKNFANMLAVIFEERSQRKLNEKLTAELEERVLERTRELQKKKEDLRITLNSIGDAVVSTDTQGKIIGLNPVAENLTGWKETEALGRNHTDILNIINNITKQPTLDPVARVLITGDTVALANHTVLIARDGTNYQIADTAAPIRGPDGHIGGVVLVFRNVTDEYRILDALKSSEEKYREIVEGTSDLITRTDDSGVLIFVNNHAEKIFGLPVSECLRKQAFDFIHPEDRARTENWFRDCVENRLELSAIENRQVNQATGAICYCLWTCNFHYDSQGRLRYVNSVAHDITDRIKAEEGHLKFEQQLHQIQKLESLGIFAGGIAHDFNNLMGGIFGFIELANSETDRKQISTYLSRAMTAMDRARDLTRQLLTFAKGGAPIQKIGPLFPFVEETVKFALSGSAVKCSFDVPEDTWSCNFDKNQIGQVIDNLIINAQQAMEAGGTIHLTARNVTLAENEHPGLSRGKYIKISVKDSGSGIDSELISRIFDPFFTTKSKGQGLGLATCYSIINRHGGCIDVESEPGKGTTFNILLPASLEPIPPSAEKPVMELQGTGAFLIMDDDEAMRDIVRDMLEKLGYSVECKKNGRDAVDFFAAENKAKRKIVGMIFDLTVPGNMGGKAALEEIRRMDADVPVFVASGYADDPVMKNPVEYGFTGSISKPFRLIEITELLAKYVGSNKQSGNK